MKRLIPRPRLRTVLLAANLVAVLVPLVFIGALRILENELVRRTEAELIAQGTVVVAAYRDALERVFEADGASLAAAVADGTYGVPADPRWLATDDPDGRLHPIPAELDRGRDPVLPPAPEPAAAERGDRRAADAGELVTPLLEYTTTVTLAGLRVVDASGVEVAASRDGAPRSLVAWDEVERALSGEPVRQLRQRISDEPPPPLSGLSRRTRVRVFVALPVLVGDRVVGAVVVTRTPVSVQKALYDGRRTLALGAALLLLVAAALALVLARLLGRPIEQLADRAERVAAGDVAAAAPLEHPGTDEVDRLSRSFVTMTTALLEREAYIRTFAANVSHEFKTPLTALRGSAELLEDHLDTMSDDERRGFLSTMIRETDRLERLVRRLLDLARADVLRPGDEASDVTETATRVCARHIDAGADVALNADERAVVRMDGAALEAIIACLVGNAVEHGGDNVRVRVDVRRDGDTVELRVHDDGAGISEANASRVFDAFFTTAREQSGTGVGLSIVRTLVTQHRGTVELERDPGTTFVIRLPRAASGRDDD